MALCLGGEMTLQPSEYAPSMLDAGRHIKAPPWNMSPGLLLAPLAACGMAMLQMALSLLAGCFRMERLDILNRE